MKKQSGCNQRKSSAFEALGLFFFSSATYEAFFSTCWLQIEYFTCSTTNKQAEKRPWQWKGSIKWRETRERETDKRRENERIEWRRRQTGSSGGLLIRESLVTGNFEMTADLRESIIRLRHATALLPPRATQEGGVCFPRNSIHALQRKSYRRHRLGKKNSQ